MLRFLYLAAFVVPFAVQAANDVELEKLHQALSTDDLMAILSEEGVEQSDELRDSMLAGRSGVGWTIAVNRIYQTEKLKETFRDAFDDALQDTDITELLDFYSSETGSRISDVEIQARRAIMSEDVEEAARRAFDDMRESGSARVGLLEEFAEANQLIDRNVTGALNANLAFFRGLGTGDGFEMTEDQILTQVWSREAEIREDTEGWVFGYMTFAYDTLSDAQIQAYIDVSSTRAGRDMNRALFAGFDAVFLDVSYELGRATSQFSVGDEL